MRVIVVNLFLFLFSTSAFSQLVSVEEFKKIADSAGLKFEMPKGYTVTKVIKNRDLDYSFAMINSDSTMEVRYTILPLKSLLKEYDAYKNSSHKANNGMITAMTDPNKLYWGEAIPTIYNLSKGKSAPTRDFPKEAVKKEFNADFGTSAMFKLDCEYGKGYVAANLINLHKENVADVIIVLLTNIKNSDAFYNEMLIPFHSLTYK